MRNIHTHLISEYGKEKVKILWWWEKIELKMANFKNHRRFSLRCLSNNIIPVSVWLKSYIKTPRGICIVKKAEKVLLKEIIGMINNTINMFSWQIGTCKEKVQRNIKKENIEECYKFIQRQRETRHLKTLERQQDMFQGLCHKTTGGHSNSFHSGIGISGHSNLDTTMPPNQQLSNITLVETQDQTQYNNKNNNWVRNLCRRPLTQAQEKVLSHRPNFAIMTQKPPIGKYIAQFEKVCQNLKKGEAEELRDEMKLILKKINPPKPNITKEEAKAIKELKGGSVIPSTKGSTLQGQVPPNIMVYQRSINRRAHWDPSSLAGGSYIWNCQKTIQDPKNP